MNNTIKILGWQSWSYPGKDSKKLPKRYLSPFGEKEFLLEAKPTKIKPPISGWCSWHWFGKNISQDTILKQAQFISQNSHLFPLDYILIDDGWCKSGDWLEANPEKFPTGMKWLASEIKKLGLKPGIWMAPFLADFSSKLFHNHPDWFIHNIRGDIEEGTKIGSFDCLLRTKRGILNLENESVRAYLAHVISTLEDWGFELLKLDFLYANHFNPKFSSSEEPDRLLNNFLSSIKASHPQIFTIACGSPIKPALYAVDAIRISDDINFPQLKGIWPFNSLICSQRLNQLENNLKHRSVLSKITNLDPDAFICSSCHGLSQSQIIKLQTIIKQANGIKFLGDDLTKLTKEEIEKYIKPLFY